MDKRTSKKYPWNLILESGKSIAGFYCSAGHFWIENSSNPREQQSNTSDTSQIDIGVGGVKEITQIDLGIGAEIASTAH